VRDRLLLIAFFFSGVSALGFELFWVRLLGLGLGSEAYGVLAVLAGFFGGLCLGAAALHRVVITARHPVRLYAISEALIASYGLLSPWLLLGAVDTLPTFVGTVVGDNQSTLALALNLAIAALLLLPATVPMGVTTAALVEVWRRFHSDVDARYGVGRLYAANTLGATVGIVWSTYWLFPRVGSVTAVAVLAAQCLIAAFTAVYSHRLSASSGAAPVRPEPPRPTDRSTGAVYAVLFATGFAAIGFEAVGTQILAQIFENTVYTFANILSVYLVGTSIGAWLYARPWARRFSVQRDRCTRALVYALAASVFAASVLLDVSPKILAWLAPTGSSYPTYVAAEIGVTAVVFLAPALLMGATFSHLLGQLAQYGVGYGYALNTGAGAVAPFVFGLLLIPRAGYGAALAVVGLLYVTLFTWLAFRGGHSRARLAGALMLMSIIAVSAYSSLALVSAPAGYRLVAQEYGLHGTVSISERPFSSDGVTVAPVRLLQVNQNFLMGGAFGYLEKRIGHLALLLANEPRNVLFLGVGTGITAGAALSYPDVKKVTAVELVPEMLGLLHWFAPHNQRLWQDARVELHASDARRFLRASADSYDVIVGELFHPTVNGGGSLFTREHFVAARHHLRPGGLFVQWLPLYQLAPRDLATIVRTFLDVFPDGHSMLGNYGAQAALGLFAWAPSSPDARHAIDLAKTAQQLQLSKEARSVVFDERDLLAAYMADAEGLHRFAGPGPMNTDLSQRILFDAPLSLGGEEQAATYRSLESLMAFRRPFPDQLLPHAEAATLTDLRSRVAPTAAAVTHFVNGDIRRYRAPREVIPHDALEEFLKAYGSDPHFPNARQMLIELAGRYPGEALRILREMARLNPGDESIARAFRRVENARGDQAVIGILREYLTGVL
jgi:spermidine synthase